MHTFSYAWSFPVTWQRWRSHHSMICSRKSRAVCKLRGSVFYRTGVIADQILRCGNGDFQPFSPVTLTLIRWPSYTNLTRIPSRYARRAKMNFLRQDFRKLSYYRIHTDIHIGLHTPPKLYITPLRGYSQKFNRYTSAGLTDYHSLIIVCIDIFQERMVSANSLTPSEKHRQILWMSSTDDGIDYAMLSC